MASVVQLADEVLVGVLSWLSAEDLVLSRQVCQDWLRVSDDDLLWRPLVTSVRPPPPHNSANNKYIYLIFYIK